MKYGILTVLIVFSMFSFTGVNALPAVPGWESYCSNSTDLLKVAHIYFNNSLYDFNQSVACPYGCDTGRDICRKWPGDALPGEYFILFEIVAMGLLMLTLYRIDIHEGETRAFDVIFPLVGFIFFVVLALQGNNVIDMSTGEAVPITMLVWYNFGFSTICLAAFFFSVFKFIRNAVSEQ